MSALTLILLALFVIWIAVLVLHWHWDSRQTLVALTVVLVVAAVNYLRAELRLRSYRLDLTSDAIIFEYGRKRSYVPREHIQLFDIESSILLRIFRLRRCNLHTGGGMVVVSPVPARVASAVTQLIYLSSPRRCVLIEHMPPRDGSAGVARPLSRKRRLHPLAILFPFTSYSRPPRLSRSIRIPRWVWFSILALVGLIVDYYSGAISVQDDASVLVQHADFTWVSRSCSRARNRLRFLLVRWVVPWWIEDDGIRSQRRLFNGGGGGVTFDHIVTIDRRPRRVCACSVCPGSRSRRRLSTRQPMSSLATCQTRTPTTRGNTDHEARIRCRTRQLRSAQCRSARVVGSHPCRSDDTPSGSRLGDPVHREPNLSGRDLSLD